MACTDADNFSRPGDDAPYVLVSGPFTVVVGDGARARGPVSARPRVAFDAAQGNLNVTLDLALAGEIRLEAFDAAGRILAVFRDRVPAGRTRRSFSAAAPRRAWCGYGRRDRIGRKRSPRRGDGLGARGGPAPVPGGGSRAFAPSFTCVERNFARLAAARGARGYISRRSKPRSP